MNALGLSAERLAERKLHLHAGDASNIMAGDYRKVFARFQPDYVEEDLSGEFRVQLGSYTEPLGLWWTEKMTGREVQYFSDNPLMCHIWHALTGRGAGAELFVSVDYPFMAANLDALTTTPQGHAAVLDAKHVARAGDAEILRYTAAGVFQATVIGSCDWWGLAPIVGNKWEPPIFQEVCPIYQAELIARCRECWGYIERREEPPAPPPIAPPKPQPKRREINLDLTPEAERPNWAGEFTRLARDFAETHGAFTRHAIVREEIKALIPDDVGKVQLGLVTYKHDGRGKSLSLGKTDE